MTRDTKYDYSMERLINLIDQYCTFPALEKLKLFRIVIFNFLIGNEDMHLKNYSIITRNSKVELSPAYDLINTTIIIKNAKEEIALPIKGKKNNLSFNLLIKYFGKERLNLTNKSIDLVLSQIQKALPDWELLINKSFLNNEMKKSYINLLLQRCKRLNFSSPLS